MMVVHYEVYVLEGRGWMLHARYPRSEREAALLEAKELERSLSLRVRVVRESYTPDSNRIEEAEVYISRGIKQPAKTAKTVREYGARGSNTGYSTLSRQRNRKSPIAFSGETRNLLWRLLVIAVLSLACAFVSLKLTPNIIMMLWKMGFDVQVTAEGYSQLLFIIFVGSFLVLAIPLSARFLRTGSSSDVSETPLATRLPLLAAPDMTAEARQRQKELKKSLRKLEQRAVAEEMFGKGDAGLDDLPPDPVQRDANALDKDSIQAAEEDARRRDEEERQRWEQGFAGMVPPPPSEPEIPPQPPVSEETAPASEPAPVSDVAAKMPEEQTGHGAETSETSTKTPDKTEFSLESLKPAMTRFVDGAVAISRTLSPAMDSYNRFALHLYLAGAAAALCQFRSMDDAKTAALIESVLVSLGTRQDLAHKFNEKLEEYELEPRYMAVLQAGHAAMGDVLLGDETGAHSILRDVFDTWNRKTEKQPQIITLMFTDMVGSTDLTQTRGDAVAQEILRRHNSIVRGALALNGGREIKHTGDGIMASFTTAAGAIEAAIAIQRQILSHNEKYPNLGLNVRIGLNAGEPIAEEDDLFGATVQLASRVCGSAAPDQILCTPVVKDLSAGKAITFRGIGERKLKGFRDAVNLFEIGWKTSVTPPSM